MANPFRDLLGKEYDRLPGAVRDFHDHAYQHYRGTAISGGARHWLAGLIRSWFGFPDLGEAQDVEIRLSLVEGRDRWQRRFGARRFASSFFPAADGTLDERFSPFRFGFRLRVENNRMYWDFERWSFLALPLPRILGPRIETWEGESDDGGFEFYSHADFPLIGRLVQYHGVVRRAD